MTVLVTCGETRAALATTRALGRAGVAVAVGAVRRPALCFWSRYATTTLLLPDAQQEARHFASIVADEVAGRGVVAVLPSSDGALWALSKWRHELPESAQRVLPPHDAVVFSLDRSALRDSAESLGIRCGVVHRIHHASTVEPVLRRLADDARTARFQALVRPLVPWEEREDGTRRLAAPLPVDGIGALRRLLYERADLVDGGCVVEPRPPGRYLGYCAVVAAGTVVAEVFQERLREQDGLSGVSTLARTIDVDDEMRAAARALLGHLRFQGAALLEFHRDDAGRLSLLNLIPRLWGSLGLALFAGVDVPRLLLRIAHDDRPPPGLVAEPGKLWRWVAGDADALRGRLRRVFSRVEGRGILHDRACDVRALVEARAALQAHPDVFAVDDPLPSALEWQQRLGRTSRGGATSRAVDHAVR